MKKLLFVLIIFSSFFSCKKEYSAAEIPVKITITGNQYLSSVNGSPGTYWALSVKVSRVLDSTIHIVYTYDDSKGYKGLTVSHAIVKGELQNIFYTQYPAVGTIQNIKLIRVDGMAGTTFILNQ